MVTDKINNVTKMIILVLLDLFFLSISIMLTVFSVMTPVVFGMNKYTIFLAVTALTQIICNLYFGVYRISLQEISNELFIRAAGVILASIITYIAAGIIDGFTIFLFKFAFVYCAYSYIGIVTYRGIYKLIMMKVARKHNASAVKQQKTLIYGAGDLGKTLVRQVEFGKLPGYNFVGFLDDDNAKIGKIIQNKKVLGSIDILAEAVKKTKAEMLVIAITQLSYEKLHTATKLAKDAGLEIKIVPSLFELSSGNKQAFDLRNINYEDLLGRRLIQIDKEPIANMINGRVVLVTGACGSIGSEICRQVKGFNPKKLIILDIDESGLHDNALRLLNYKREWSDEVIPVLCDIKDKQKLERIFNQYKPELVFHAAAYKHVPMVQLYPEEGFRTNVFGSYNVLKTAKETGVNKVIVISTDKAVNPTNVMGATKRIVELEAAMLNSIETEITCVRFGNVLGSRGSMLPLFIEEIQAGVPITVTDKKIIRYFMAIPEAVSLVFLAGAMGKGGEVMVLDMGQPVNIYEFAQKLISIYGDPNKNEIVITGLRPGEKMYEELLANKDNTIPTDNKLIFKAKLNNTVLNENEFVSSLENVITSSPETVVDFVHKIVPEFK